MSFHQWRNSPKATITQSGKKLTDEEVKQLEESLNRAMTPMTEEEAAEWDRMFRELQGSPLDKLAAIYGIKRG